tara:strand:+ start:105 stop:419 length:315 start_codon:yes stop_codon:yes gene_type:complete
MTSVFGWIVVAGTFLYKIPQIYKLYKTKSSNDISSTSLTIQTSGYIFYILHGFIIDDKPTLFMGGISFLQSFILLFLCCIYRKSTIKNDIKEPYVTQKVVEIVL